MHRLQKYLKKFEERGMWLKIKRLFSQFIKIVLPLLLGCGLLWYIYKDIEFGQIAEVLTSGIRYEWLLFSLIFGLAGNLFRGLRWGLLTVPLGYKPRKLLLMLAVVGNYGVNLVLPRIGEVWRCGIVAKYEKQSFSKLFGTLLVDRLYDVIAIAVILLLSFFLTPRLFLSFFEGQTPSVSGFSWQQAAVWAAIFAAVAVVLWGGVVLVRRFAFFGRIRRFFANVLDGLRSFWTIEHKWRFLFYSLAIWGAYFLYFYTTFFAFEFTRSFSPACGLAIFALTCVSVIVPVQGAIGPWHFVVILGLTSLGVPRGDAAAFALIVHTLQTLWVAVTGLASVLAIPIIYKNEKSTR